MSFVTGRSYSLNIPFGKKPPIVWFGANPPANPSNDSIESNQLDGDTLSEDRLDITARTNQQDTDVNSANLVAQRTHGSEPVKSRIIVKIDDFDCMLLGCESYASDDECQEDGNSSTDLQTQGRDQTQGRVARIMESFKSEEVQECDENLLERFRNFSNDDSTLAPVTTDGKIQTQAVELTVESLKQAIQKMALKNGIPKQSLEILDTDSNFQQDLQNAATNLLQTSNAKVPLSPTSGLGLQSKKIQKQDQNAQKKLFQNTAYDLFKKHVIDKGIKSETKTPADPDGLKNTNDDDDGPQTKTGKSGQNLTDPTDPDGLKYNDDGTPKKGSFYSQIPLTPSLQKANDDNSQAKSDAAETDSAISGGKSTPPKAGKTPLNEQNGKTATVGVKKTQKAEGVTPPPAVNSKTSADNDNTKTKPKDEQNNENQSVWSGYVGTKIGVGAALLAGGIALKLTLIGIVPGLIMAGAGAAIMAWGAVNYMFNNNNEEKKA